MTLFDLVVGFLLLPVAFFDTATRSPVEFQSERVTIENRSFVLYHARTTKQWQQGFKSHEVARDEAMLFQFPSSGWKMFWMKGTVTPLDIIFLDSELKILKIHRNAQPCKIFCRPYFGNGQYVLELRAGVADELKLERGRKLVIG